MKRIITLVAVAAASLLMASRAHAQFGIVAGLTSSKANMTDAVNDAKNIALYHAGLTYKIDLGAGFAVQPSVIYQVKGANVGSLDTSREEDWKLKTGFVEIPVGIQWGPDLMVFRPYVFAEPFVGYQISSSDSGNSTFGEWTKEAKNKFEYGFGVGGGLEIASHLQLSVQWFKNMGVMFGEEAQSAGAAWEQAKDVKNFQGIKVTLGILF
jgi:hypothetical protein